MGTLITLSGLACIEIHADTFDLIYIDGTVDTRPGSPTGEIIRLAHEYSPGVKIKSANRTYI